jgi:predicted dehydrogenase
MGGNRISRRHFFYGTLLAGAIPAAGLGRVPSLKRLGYKSPNEKLNIAAIGAGGRAEINLAEVETENLVAFADPDSARAGNTFEVYPNVPRYKDFRVMLDKEGDKIDAVMITIPDHAHAVAALYAMERGKHVYLEKPLTRTVWEARLLRDAAARTRVATQMGNQGYSAEGERIAAEIIWSGEIGNVTEVHAWTDRPIWPQGMAQLPPEEKVPETLDWDIWLGPAATRPYSSAYLPFNWRGWFDFGCGSLGDMACHILGAANMALKLQAPSGVEVIKQEGKNSYTFPKQSITRFDFPARGSMPPLKIFWYDGAKAAMYRPAGIPENEPLISGPGAFGQGGVATAPSRPLRRVAQTPAAAPPTSFVPPSARIDMNGCVFVGEKGFLTTDTYGHNVRLLPESRHKEYKLPPQYLTRSPGHYRDWIRACKGGEPACSNFNIAAPFTEWLLLGAVALRFEGKLDWDAARMKFTNNSEANKYVTPYIRKGWKLTLPKAT